MTHDDDEATTQIVRRLSFSERLPLVVFPQRGDPLSDESLGAVSACIERYLSRLGCILFRGFGIDGNDDFLRLTRAFGHPMRLIQEPPAGHRLDVSNMFTQSEHTSGLVRAMTRYSQDPAVHWLRCAEPGQLTKRDCLFADTRELYQVLPAHVRLRFAARQLRYQRTFDATGAASWPILFRSHRRLRIEQSCRNMGWGYEWLEGDRLRVWLEAKAIVRHSSTGEVLWSNDLLRLAIVNPFEPFNPAQPLFSGSNAAIQVTYADGAPIEPSIGNELRLAFEAVATAIHWEPGDVLAIDGELGWHASASVLTK